MCICLFIYSIITYYHFNIILIGIILKVVLVIIVWVLVVVIGAITGVFFSYIATRVFMCWQESSVRTTIFYSSCSWYILLQLSTILLSLKEVIPAALTDLDKGTYSSKELAVGIARTSCSFLFFPHQHLLNSQRTCQAFNRACKNVKAKTFGIVNSSK